MRWGHGRFRRERLGGRLRLAPRRLENPLAIGRSGGMGTLCYSTRSAHWWLWWPCPDCGGVRLPLRGSAGGRPPVYVVRAAAVADGCPGCQTLRLRRSASARGPGPVVWYDTLLSDWVVRLNDAAILPLELRWFDLPQPAVYRAAGDLAYLGDVFDGELGEDGRRRPDGRA
jgi:hypothetical protein